MYDQESALWKKPLACPGRYANRVAVVTGGASGIGEATVVRILREGGNVLFGDIDRKRSGALLDLAASHGFKSRLRFLRCNVNEEGDIAELINTAVREFARLDLMVNCAGASGHVGPFLDTSTEDWDGTIRLILDSVFWGTRLAAKGMIRCGNGGAIVNVASVAALGGGLGGAAYSTAKAGAVNLTRSAAIHLGSRRIRCNAVCPGNIVTPLLIRGGSAEKMERAAVRSQAWPEAGRSDQVATAIAFLGSDQAKFVTGCVLTVDGGIVAGSPGIFEWKPGSNDYRANDTVT